MPNIIDHFTYLDALHTIQFTPDPAGGGALSIFPDNDLATGAVISQTDRGRDLGDFISTQTYNGQNISFYADLAYPFATFTIDTTNPGDGGGGNPTPACDVAITGIATQNETALNAHDGQITITATTSHGPILYTIDGTNYQSSPTFTGLPAGGGTVYAKDAQLCYAIANYVIFTTPVIINRLVATPILNGSRWSALFNPIVFGYQSAVHAPGRKFITQITSGYDGATNTITATHAANLTGYCRADISKYLRTLLQPRDDLDYTPINYRDANISASYTVQYKEVWDGGGDDYWTSAGDPFYVTYSAMQIGNKTGGNMAPYVTSPDAVQAAPAKFLNDFKHPAFYTDMPWDISFIYSEKVAGYQLKLGGNGIDINGNICGALGEAMLLNEDGSVLLNQDGSKLLIEKQAPGVLYNKLGVNRLRVTQNIPANAIWLDIFVFYTDTNGANIPVTESRRLLLDRSPCNGLPYEYLKWMGPTGGWLYYMFTKNHLHELNTANPVLMENYISDYASADSSHQQISISAQRKITAGKNDIPAHEAEALATLLYSPKVYRLVDAATNTWQGVIIDTKSVKMYQTYGNRGDFEVSYLLPEINVQRG